MDAVERGCLIGETPRDWPGLSPLSKKLHDLQKEVQGLEESDHALGSIRATLLLNFGNTEHNRHWFVLKDEGTTLSLLMKVLGELGPASIGATTKQPIDQIPVGDPGPVPPNPSAEWVVGYRDGYAGSWLAPVRWACISDYRNGWQNGKQDREAGKSSQFPGPWPTSRATSSPEE